MATSGRTVRGQIDSKSRQSIHFIIGGTVGQNFRKRSLKITDHIASFIARAVVRSTRRPFTQRVVVGRYKHGTRTTQAVERKVEGIRSTV
jgi:hypothetical protein